MRAQGIVTPPVTAPAPSRPAEPVESPAPLLESREIILLAGVVSAGLLVRLILISQPFVDRWSSRQSDVAMIARNFYRHGFNLFYPQVDWAGASPGYVGTEFPLLPFATALLYLVFGVHEWVGRSVSVLFWAGSAPFLLLLVRKVSSPRSAAIAVVLYAVVPLGVFASRSFMPDMASLGLSITALYLFAEWLDRRPNARWFLAAGVSTSLAILVKLPAIAIGLPLVSMAARTYGAGLLGRRELWAFAALSLIPALGWYLHAYIVSVRHFPHHMFGEGGLQIRDVDTYIGLLRDAATSSLTPLVSAVALAGIVLRPRGRFGGVFHWWLIAIVVFLVLAGRGAEQHPWYQLPLVPVAAALGGRACDAALETLERHAGARAALMAGVLYLVAVVLPMPTHLQPLYEPWAHPLREAGNALDRLAPANGLVAVADYDPTAIYYSGRKGWRFGLEGYQRTLPWDRRDPRDAVEEVERLREQAVEYLAFTRRSRWWFDLYPGFQQALNSRYRRLHDTDDYTIYDLRMPRPGQETEPAPAEALVSPRQAGVFADPDTPTKIRAGR